MLRHCDGAFHSGRDLNSAANEKTGALLAHRARPFMRVPFFLSFLYVLYFLYLITSSASTPAAPAR
jgi:hypothetical protein